MISTEELMTGNYLDIDGEHMPVLIVGDDYVIMQNGRNYNSTLERIKPIELSYKELINLGFDMSCIPDRMIIMLNSEMHHELQLSVYNSTGGWGVEENGNRDRGLGMKMTVHQFQNYVYVNYGIKLVYKPITTTK